MAFAKLTPLKIANAKPGWHGDGGGLWLKVQDSGAMSWVFRWTRNGLSRSVGLGSADTVSADEARDAAHENRKRLRNGENPRPARAKEAKAKPVTFQQEADDWIDHKKGGWSKLTRTQREYRLGKYMFPIELEDGRLVGNVPVNEFDTDIVLAVLRPIWETKNVTARNLRYEIEMILDFSKAMKRREGDNPARWRGHLSAILPKPGDVHRRRHHPAIQFGLAPAFLAGMHNRVHNRGTSVGGLALEFIVHCPVRISTLLLAEWDEFHPVETHNGVEFPERKWSVPEQHMKGYKKIGFPDGIYTVPVTDPMTRILKRLWEFREDAFVCPGRKPNRHLTSLAVLWMTHRLTTREVCTHGFRSTFESWADERTFVEESVKEMCLGHSVGTETQKAYRRSDLFEKRRLLMEAWGQFLITGKDVPVDIKARFMKRFADDPILLMAEAAD